NFYCSNRRRHTRFSRDWSSDVCSSDLAVQLQRLQLVTSNRNAIGYVGIGYLIDKLPPLKLDGVEPSHDTVRDGSWPVARTLWVFTNNWRQGETLKFIQYVRRAEQGQKVVESTGYVPLY